MLGVSLLHFPVETEVLGMETPILPLKLASRTMGLTKQSSSLSFQLLVPSTCLFPLLFTTLLMIQCSVTAVGGTIHVPEVAVDFSGGT